MNKTYADAAAALDGLLHDGMTILAGGFGLCGIGAKIDHVIVASIFSFIQTMNELKKSLLIKWHSH